MRYAIIENDMVVNIITADRPDVLPGIVPMEALPGTVIGDVLVDGALPVPPALDPAAVLERVKAAALAQIDVAAENERVKYITSGSGQAMVYQQKQAEAHAWVANPGGTYPHLNAEIGITGATLEDVAQTVLAMEAAWVQISAAIEGMRLTAKALVRDCTTGDEVEQIISDLRWPFA